MPVSDLFAASRRILRYLLGRSHRRAAWAAAIVPLGALGTPLAKGAPTPALPPGFPVTPFSMRVTDMERIESDLEGDAFRLSLETLNWTPRSAFGLMMSANVGSSAVEGGIPYFAGASVDGDGRGGAPGGADIGAGVFDPTAIHSGWGRGDSPGFLNDWVVASASPTSVQWRVFEGTVEEPNFVATSIPEHWITYSGGGSPRLALVPGYGLDALGDSAIDGGPAPYSPPTPGGGEPDEWWERNAVDGFVIDVDDWDENEVFSLNWFLATFAGGSGDYPNQFYPIGDAGRGDPFGFGVMSLVRIAPSIGSPAANLPGQVFVDNVGFDQSNFSFYDTVYEIPNPAEFAAEFGAAITAPFLNPADNVFNVPVNTSLAIPEPASGALIALAAGMLIAAARPDAKE